MNATSQKALERRDYECANFSCEFVFLLHRCMVCASVNALRVLRHEKALRVCMCLYAPHVCATGLNRDDLDVKVCVLVLTFIFMYLH